MVKKICIALAAIVLCSTSAAAADGEWFVSSDKTFTKLIADGFEIVGFTALNKAAAVLSPGSVKLGFPIRKYSFRRLVGREPPKDWAQCQPELGGLSFGTLRASRNGPSVSIGKAKFSSALAT